MVGAITPIGQRKTVRSLLDENALSSTGSDPPPDLMVLGCVCIVIMSEAAMNDYTGVLEQLRRIVDVAADAEGDRATRARCAAEIIQRVGGFNWVGLYDVEPDAIVAIAWTGDAAPAFPRFPRANGLNGAAAAEGTPVVANDVSRDDRYLTTFGPTRAEMIVPVCNDVGEVVGTIDVESTVLGAFGPAQQELVQHCARALAPLWAR